ncbi:MAG: hypothetical protein WD270_01770 [Acetobacterales bacterium]
MDRAVFRRAGKALSMAAMLMALSASGEARAQAALATGVSGTTTPPVEPFTELPSGTGIVLAADAEIEFVHYASCEAVRVRGGRLSITRRSFAVTGGGKVLDVSRAGCPQAIVLGPIPEIGGLLVREGGAPIRIPRRPLFVLVGSGSDQPARLVVSTGGSELAAAEMKGKTVRWPNDAAPLETGQEYEVTLLAADGRLLGRFDATAVGSARDGTPTVLRLE